MDLDIGLGIDGVGETGKLRDPAKVRDEVLGDLASTRSAVHILRVLRMQLSCATKQGRGSTLTSTTSSAAFFENWRKVSKSSTWTIAALACSDSFFSAAFFCKPRGENRDVNALEPEITNLLSGNHLGIGCFGVVQEDLVDRTR